MQTRQQTRRIQEQKNKDSSQPKESTRSPINSDRTRIIEESMAAMNMTPTTLQEMNTLTSISSRSRRIGGLSWLNIAATYRVFQVSWSVVCNSICACAQLTNLATSWKLTATRILNPSVIDAAYLKADKQIAAITDDQTKEFALRVFPSKTQFMRQVNLGYRTADEYINSHK